MFFFLFFLSLVLVILVSFIFLVISYKKMLDVETFSSYECGFNMMSSVRIFFSFRFFLVSILFLIFDVEIALMLPIPFLVFKKNMMYMVYLFFMILVVGLMYEYYYGSLNWLTFISKA
uniref:NADH-ubiquinone oxidoreductase chain 3 n=1 Tax=Hypsosinga pygmaea TaxID=336661 RepID=A0A0U2KDG1_9ARAC|nr:NADH dehydrogenase subunit 3 [Hypsosinga pygmaea]ALF36393.1 NADH dehydrogenase subunit 3 [Hypsosinga pygmaea]